MSLDNVIAVAGAAHGSLVLLLFGLAVSIPLIVWSSQLILRWMERYPVIVLFGAALLGYVSGQMIFTDPGVLGLLPPLPAWSGKLAGAVGAVLVVAVGRWLEQRILARQDVTLV
jgi:predicted tellurium resistance membrane protein TerC